MKLEITNLAGHREIIDVHKDIWWYFKRKEELDKLSKKASNSTSSQMEYNKYLRNQRLVRKYSETCVCGTLLRVWAY